MDLGVMMKTYVKLCNNWPEQRREGCCFFPPHFPFSIQEASTWRPSGYKVKHKKTKMEYIDALPKLLNICFVERDGGGG